MLFHKLNFSHLLHCKQIESDVYASSFTLIMNLCLSPCMINKQNAVVV